MGQRHAHGMTWDVSLPLSVCCHSSHPPNFCDIQEAGNGNSLTSTEEEWPLTRLELPVCDDDLRKFNWISFIIFKFSILLILEHHYCYTPSLCNQKTHPPKLTCWLQVYSMFLLRSKIWPKGTVFPWNVQYLIWNRMRLLTKTDSGT